MPELTPDLYAADTTLHKEIRNRPARRGRILPDAPPPKAADEHGKPELGPLYGLLMISLLPTRALLTPTAPWAPWVPA
ncbi:hypothetical protein GCM10012286_03640 [Streptomyces lasiicapitis]|uniref:Transposase n=1 Tax=Streptomyces lasiicapitis TaxID=1923961 RepID=A0ABQ2LHL2_9ACTN|nr:hypothetical protein GCM10012286_03640 [Streptomyces lasiicapitis]